MLNSELHNHKSVPEWRFASAIVKFFVFDHPTWHSPPEDVLEIGREVHQDKWHFPDRAR